MIRLDLLNVGIIEETGDVLLILRSPEKGRLLVIETGILEGQAIALAAQGVRTERPLTHDLLYQAIDRLGATVKEVQIHAFEDEAYHARILLTKGDGVYGVELDARPSDAIALALLAGAPIEVADDILEEMGVPEDQNGRFAELFDDDPGDLPQGRMVH